jgi:hypothetical protein
MRVEILFFFLRDKALIKQIQDAYRLSIRMRRPPSKFWVATKKAASGRIQYYENALDD